MVHERSGLRDRLIDFSLSKSPLPTAAGFWFSLWI
jgi:hypothetical protein